VRCLFWFRLFPTKWNLEKKLREVLFIQMFSGWLAHNKVPKLFSSGNDEKLSRTVRFDSKTFFPRQKSLLWWKVKQTWYMRFDFGIKITSSWRQLSGCIIHGPYSETYSNLWHSKLLCHK
jgi:hypothetical protein